jgi:hypothetical protein
VVRFPAKSINVSPLKKSIPAVGPILPTIKRVMGSFDGAKQPEREAYHSPPPIAEVKNEWSCISIPTYNFMARKWTVSPH